jgi:hypothetical protein
VCRGPDTDWPQTGKRTESSAISSAVRTRSVTADLPSPVVDETRTYNVSLVLKDSSHAVDVFYKYRGERLPEEGEVIDVVRLLRGRVTRARVTRVDANSDPQIAATRID